MIQIKFRAWDKKAKKMFPVHELEFHKISDKLTKCVGYDDHDQDGWTVHGGSNNSYANGERYELLQYIGIKDRNGREIYKGDIVKWASDGMPHMIEWSEPNAGFAIVSTSDGITLYEFDMSDLHEAEVIGNVWQNPELLEVPI